MAICEICRYGGEGGGGNFGAKSIVCNYYGSLECDPEGDCQNFEELEDEDSAAALDEVKS